VTKLVSEPAAADAALMIRRDVVDTEPDAAPVLVPAANDERRRVVFWLLSLEISFMLDGVNGINDCSQRAGRN
jgi:hypothetical protein